MQDSKQSQVFRSGKSQEGMYGRKVKVGKELVCGYIEVDPNSVSPMPYNQRPTLQVEIPELKRGANYGPIGF
jgi:hypothetical protein